MRRPLGPIERPDNLQYLSPHDRLLAVFGMSSPAMPPYQQYCTSPLLLYPTIDGITGLLGLDFTPKGRTDIYPKEPLTAPSGRKQHSTQFFQWGWAVKPNKQALFEIGDSAFLTSIHFMKETPGNNATPWHLDMIEIDTGNEEIYHLACDDNACMPHIRKVLAAVSQSVQSLNNDRWEDAEAALNPVLRVITNELDEIAERMSREHANEWHASAMRDRRQGSVLPKAP